MIDVFTAVTNRYETTELHSVLNGLFVGAAFPNTNRPYAIVMPLTDGPKSETNKAEYRDNTFTIEVQANDFDTATRLAYLIRDRMVKPPLEFTADHLTGAVPPGRLLYLSRGNVTWTEEDQYWRAMVEFTATVTR